MSHPSYIAVATPLPKPTPSVPSIRWRLALMPAASRLCSESADRNRPESIAERDGLGAGMNQEPGAEVLAAGIPDLRHRLPVSFPDRRRRLDLKTGDRS